MTTGDEGSHQNKCFSVNKKWICSVFVIDSLSLSLLYMLSVTNTRTENHLHSIYMASA